ncbi:helix-turn-helix domain-containing protein [Glycomyces sp. NPDC047010]|uniref:helix-turn-helix domain-containing protein n=1 Tax=Glycomyces sp. NPDC047010 TaxID=3155023 RepID=UPI003400F8A3
MTGGFGELLRRRRRQAGLTQEELAEASGISVKTIRAIENGKRLNPNVNTIRALADGLELKGADRANFLAAVGQDTAPPPEDHRTVPTGREEPGFTDPLLQAAVRLARNVGSRWKTEEAHQRVHDPVPLPVRWSPMSGADIDDWASICQVPRREDAAPIDLAGRLGEITETYRRIPSGRLIVLGRPGAGKSILALRFVLDMLDTRGPNEPVPVVFSFASWDPAASELRPWLIDQLIRDFPDLGAPEPGGTSTAASLVQAGLILPVLDGFDELAGQQRSQALDELNRNPTQPLLITSRAREFKKAVSEGGVLKQAAGVELEDLGPADLAEFLPRTTRRTIDGAPLWKTVLDRLHDTAGANVAAALATPLTVSLARTVYSDSPDRDPAELLDAEAYPDTAAVERHLLAAFVPSVYRTRPGLKGHAPEKAGHWLGHLADHLDRQAIQDLAWWRLGDHIPLRKRMLIMALATGPVFGLVDLAVESYLNGGVSMYIVVFAAAFGLVTGAAFGLAHGLSVRFRGRTIEPSRIRIHIGGGADRTPLTVARRFRTGFVSGLAVGLGYGLLRGLLNVLGRDIGFAESLTLASVDTFLFGLVFALSAGFVLALMALCEVPLETESVASPEALLRSSRTTVIVQVLVFGTTFALVLPLAIWLVIALLQPLTPIVGVAFVWNPLAGLMIGLVGGIGGGLAYALSMTAWGQWLVFARLWLPLTGRLPWAVPTFFQDAYRRGVLRRTGVHYRFRHARLQQHLAATHRSTHQN